MIKSRIGAFRMNYSVIPGLYAVGEPTSDSDVFVTANYKLTFDILRRELKDLNAWILALDTKEHQCLVRSRQRHLRDRRVDQTHCRGKACISVVSHRKKGVPCGPAFREFVLRPRPPGRGRNCGLLFSGSIALEIKPRSTSCMARSSSLCASRKSARNANLRLQAGNLLRLHRAFDADQHLALLHPIAFIGKNMGDLPAFTHDPHGDLAPRGQSTRGVYRPDHRFAARCDHRDRFPAPEPVFHQHRQPHPFYPHPDRQ